MSRFEPDAFELEPYVWYDPWELAERAAEMMRQWDLREDCFRQDMRMAQGAAMDNTYLIRRQLETLMEKVADVTAFQQPPIFITR